MLVLSVVWVLTSSRRMQGGAKGLAPDASPENLRRSIDNINSALRGTKKLDLFESARVDKNVPIEDAIKTLAALIKEGKFDHIGMSECSAATLRQAHAVSPEETEGVSPDELTYLAQVHPITAVEIEVSPWSYEEETKKVIATAQELGIAVVAYS